jgi:hypothetical protein
MSTPQVAKHLDVIYRQLDYWIGRGWITGLETFGSGDPRRWEAEQVARAREIRDAFDRATKVLEGVGVTVPERAIMRSASSHQGGRIHPNSAVDQKDVMLWKQIANENRSEVKHLRNLSRNREAKLTRYEVLEELLRVQQAAAPQSLSPSLTAALSALDEENE